jgi:hypothetical protein
VINIYPNPFYDNLYIQSTSAKIDITITDILGRIIFSDSGRDFMDVSTQNWSNKNCYIITVRNENKKIIQSKLYYKY